MSVRDRVRRTGLDTISAEDAAVVVDVVDLRVTLGAGDARLACIVRRLDVNAVRWAGRRTQEAGNALFQAILIALQHMGAAETVLKVRAAIRSRAVRIVLYLGRLEHFAEGDRHSLGDTGNVAHDRHAASIRRPTGCTRSCPPQQSEGSALCNVAITSSVNDNGANPTTRAAGAWACAASTCIVIRYINGRWALLPRGFDRAAG